MKVASVCVRMEKRNHVYLGQFGAEYRYFEGPCSELTKQKQKFKAGVENSYPAPIPSALALSHSGLTFNAQLWGPRVFSESLQACPAHPHASGSAVDLTLLTQQPESMSGEN